MGGTGKFFATLTGRETIRNGYATTYTITYGNNGTVDMPAQLLSIGTNPLSSRVSARFLPSGSWQIMSQPMTMLCTGSSANQTVLPAGSKYTQEVSVKGDSIDSFTINLIPYGNSEVYSPHTVESVTDAQVSAPGIPLAIGRSYASGPLQYNGPVWIWMGTFV